LRLAGELQGVARRRQKAKELTFSLGKALTRRGRFGILRIPLHTGGKQKAPNQITTRSEENQRMATKKKAAAKKPAAKKPAKKKAAAKRKPNAAFMKPVTPTPMLAAVIGASAAPRTEITKKIWAYIKKNNLQDKKNRRNINADDKLKPIFGGKAQVSMFDLTKLVSKQLKS